MSIPLANGYADRMGETGSYSPQGISHACLAPSSSIEVYPSCANAAGAFDASLTGYGPWGTLAPTQRTLAGFAAKALDTIGECTQYCKDSLTTTCWDLRQRNVPAGAPFPTTFYNLGKNSAVYICGMENCANCCVNMPYQDCVDNNVWLYNCPNYGYGGASVAGGGGMSLYNTHWFDGMCYTTNDAHYSQWENEAKRVCDSLGVTDSNPLPLDGPSMLASLAAAQPVLGEEAGSGGESAAAESGSGAEAGSGGESAAERRPAVASRAARCAATRAQRRRVAPVRGAAAPPSGATAAIPGAVRAAASTLHTEPA